MKKRGGTFLGASLILSLLSSQEDSNEKTNPACINSFSFMSVNFAGCLQEQAEKYHASF
jgi:hypothetical protein